MAGAPKPISEVEECLGELRADVVGVVIHHLTEGCTWDEIAEMIAESQEESGYCLRPADVLAFMLRAVAESDDLECE